MPPVWDTTSGKEPQVSTGAPHHHTKEPEVSTLVANFHVGQRLKIRNGWNAGRTARVIAVTQQRVTVALDNGMPAHWRLDVAGWMPRVEAVQS